MVLLERLSALGARWRGPYQCGRLHEEMIFKLRLEEELTRNVLVGVGGEAGSRGVDGFGKTVSRRGNYEQKEPKERGHRIPLKEVQHIHQL